MNKKQLLTAMLSATLLGLTACKGRKSDAEAKETPAPVTLEAKPLVDCSKISEEKKDQSSTAAAAKGTDKGKGDKKDEGPKTKKECEEQNAAKIKLLWEALEKDEAKFVEVIDSMASTDVFDINKGNSNNKTLFEVASDKNKAKALMKLAALPKLSLANKVLCTSINNKDLKLDAVGGAKALGSTLLSVRLPGVLALKQNSTSKDVTSAVTDELEKATTNLSIETVFINSSDKFNQNGFIAGSAETNLAMIVCDTDNTARLQLTNSVSANFTLLLRARTETKLRAKYLFADKILEQLASAQLDGDLATYMLIEQKATASVSDTVKAALLANPSNVEFSKENESLLKEQANQEVLTAFLNRKSKKNKVDQGQGGNKDNENQDNGDQALKNVQTATDALKQSIENFVKAADAYRAAVEAHNKLKIGKKSKKADTTRKAELRKDMDSKQQAAVALIQDLKSKRDELNKVDTKNSANAENARQAALATLKEVRVVDAVKALKQTL